MLEITGDADADKFVSEDPLGLLIAMVLDQQIPLERAFRSPADLKERLGGTLDVGAVASMDPDELAAQFSIRPALHRFPGSMARRVQELCRVVIDNYGGDAAAVWTSAKNGDELLANVKALPGFGEQKARIFVALLGKQFAVRPPGGRRPRRPSASRERFAPWPTSTPPKRSGKVRQYKQQLKAEAKALAKTTLPAKAKAPPGRTKGLPKAKAKAAPGAKTKARAKASGNG